MSKKKKPLKRREHPRRDRDEGDVWSGVTLLNSDGTVFHQGSAVKFSEEEIPLDEYKRAFQDGGIEGVQILDYGIVATGEDYKPPK